MDIVSTIITKNEYSISKSSKDLKNTTSHLKSKECKEIAEAGDQLSMLENSTPSRQKDSQSKGRRSRVIIKDQPDTLPSVPSQSGSKSTAVEGKEEQNAESATQLGHTRLKSSLKHSGGEKVPRSVTWADEKMDGAESRDLCEVSELEVKKEGPTGLGGVIDNRDDNNADRFASAEACAMALSQAAEAIASGETDVTDAGIP